VLVERAVPRLLIVACPCGFGDKIIVNLDPRAGPAWRAYWREAELSLYPSVWRETGCRSHFVVWSGRVYFFTGDGDSWDEQYLTSMNDGEVLALLPVNGLQDITVLADKLNSIPWEVLLVCRRLVRRGLAIEGRGRFRFSFGRRN